MDVKSKCVDVESNHVDVKGNIVDVKSNYVDVKNNHVGVKGNSVDVKGNGVGVTSCLLGGLIGFLPKSCRSNSHSEAQTRNPLAGGKVEHLRGGTRGQNHGHPGLLGEHSAYSRQLSPLQDGRGY
eukprot:2750903-Pyramimonas_sp.AAC.1